MLGPVLAFRGEIEAQGRGSLHPHILVWLVCRHLQVVTDLAKMLRAQKHLLQQRLRTFMRMVVASFESIAHASVQAAPRLFGDLEMGKPLLISAVACNLCKYDGGCDLDLLREMPELSDYQREFLSASSEDDWRRPMLDIEAPTRMAASVYSTPINCLPVAQTPRYRLRGLLCAEEDQEAAEAEFGSRGRLRPIQLTPFEVQTSYGGIVAGRQNLDVQDMRRVLDPSLWLTSADCLPQIGGPATELGYMALFEWNGSQYECRPPSSAVPVSWAHWSHQAAAFREDWLRAHQGKELADDRAAAGGSPPASPSEPTEEDDDVDFDLAIRCGVNEAFADGVNSGFYVNSYTTKPNPGLGGVLEELRRGIERLEGEREAREQLRAQQEEQAQAAGQQVPGRRGVLFAETLKTLTRLSSSYRRCHWKSAAEVIFPLLYQHLTFASHRTWKLYTKKAIFFCLEAWRRRHGSSVLRSHEAAGEAGEPVIFCRESLDDLVLRGWHKVQRRDELTGEPLQLFVGPEGQTCATVHEVFEQHQAARRLCKLPQHKLTFVQELLKQHAVQENVADAEESGAVTNLRAFQETGDDAPVLAGDRVAQRAGYLSVTTSSLEDYLFRGDHPVLADMSWSTYGMWVYRVELPPGADTSIRAAVPRFMDVYFSPSYKLYNTHCQRISTEPRVPMFEGFTMPTLTTDSERNALYKQLQCRPFSICESKTGEISAEDLVVDAFAVLSQPRQSRSRNPSLAAATAFTESYLEWFADAETAAAQGRLRLAERQEYPSLWETEELQAAMAEKLALAQPDDDELIAPAFADSQQPRATVAMYTSMLAMERVANLEGLARARQHKPKKRRDVDQYLQQDFVKLTTAGEHGEVDEEDDGEEAHLERTKQPDAVFQPIVFRPSPEEQRRLLQLGYQGRKNKYTNEFLEETWLQQDAFEVAQAAPKDCHKHKAVFTALSSLEQASEQHV
ncbi:unnamed protein product [Effrenium voratum]|nr:unnamed protein product [Effrenium voratum]